VGIGEACARRLAEVGLNLVLVARREDRMRGVADELHLRHAVAVWVIASDLSAGISRLASTGRRGS